MTDNDEAREARLTIARHLAELHKLHLALAADSRRLKTLSNDGRGQAEIEIAAEMLEQYMAATGAFLENMRGASGHGPFWYSFSRLCAALRQAEKRVG